MTPSKPFSKLAYSISEFCTLVGLGRTGAFREIRTGRLRAVKVGRRTLIPAAEVRAWLDRLMEASARQILR